VTTKDEEKAYLGAALFVTVLIWYFVTH